MTKSPVKGEPGRPTKYEIFDRNISIAWEESVLYEPRKTEYVPEGKCLRELMEGNPEFTEEEIKISFRKLNKEAEQVFEENKEMMEADEPVQQEVMFWGSMAELDENETVYDREIKVWLLEHPPAMCTRKRPAPKKKQKTTGTLSNLTEEEKAALVSDLVDSVSKGETSQEYTPDSFPTLSELRMVLDEPPPKVRKIPPKVEIPPKDQKKSHPREDPLFPLKQKSIPMLLAGAQIEGPQDGPTVAEYLGIKLFAGKKRSIGSRVLASISGRNSGSVQVLGSGLGHQKTNGPTVAVYLNHNLSAGGPGPSSCSAPGSGLVLGSGSCSGSGPTPGAHTEEPEENPNHDQSPQATNSDPRPQDSEKDLEEDRDTLETSDSGAQDDSQAKGSEVSQEELDASRLAAGYRDLGPQYDDDGAQNYFEPDDFFEDQEGFVPQDDSGSQAQDDEDPKASGLGRMPAEDDGEEMELQEDFVPQDDSGSQAQDDEDPKASGLGRMPAEDNGEEMELQEDFVPQDDSGSQAQDDEDPKASGLGRMPAEDDGEKMELQEDFVPQDDSGSQAQDDEDPKASGLGRMPAEDKEEDMELQEEASDDNRQEHSPNTSSSGLQGGSQAQNEQSSNASGSGHMPVEDVVMDSGSDLDEDPEDGLGSLADTQRLLGSESSSAMPEMAVEHQNPLTQKDEDLEPEDSGAQDNFSLQDRQEDQATSKPGSANQDVVPDDQEPQEEFEPEDDHQAQPGSDPETENNDDGHQEDQEYVPEEGEEDWELQEEIELQEVQEPEPFGPVFGLFEDQDRELQRAHIELQDQEYQDPNLPEPEREPGRLSPERGTYSGIPVWEMYQRAKKMFEDLRKAALESSGSDSADESSSAEEEAEEAEEGVLAEEAIIVDEHEERGKQN
ncbi:hypothetical protein CAEBREN_08713 [Caenorhabditis brenneri]|uniref:Uncharacterized protein n=1 Tax=Caenorhabditis brenneri TaxID=135651 RepID=G0NE01_CAEBE|nr:hypothetical protein CAEBREN_08713 [Caenorhabditis brenneri]